MDNLNWMKETTDYLVGTEIEIHKDDDMRTQEDNNTTNADMGPAPEHSFDPENKAEECIKYFGYVDSGSKPILSEEDEQINQGVQECVTKSKSKKYISVDYPEVSSVPVNEYGDQKIFALAFPWLFPGGLGDIKEFDGNLSTWGSNLLFYEDARFAKDKLFSFFAMNYIIRHRNSSSGNWFISDFSKNCPTTLSDLKEAIGKGDTTFVNSINYYNGRVKGSSSYWQKKRQEVYSWINYHMERKHGAPTYFITLSCAEYFWADILRLIKERMILEGKTKEYAETKCSRNAKGFVETISDYGIIVQEYFQQRTEIWLKTVGKQVFGIDHYWVRYEFAPGRGQIHAHLLAIPEDQTVFQKAYNDSLKSNSSEGRKKIKADIISKWAKQKFGLTAEVDNDFDSIGVDLNDSPTAIRFNQVPANPISRREDGQRCLKYCQTHTCSGFCMREDRRAKGYVPHILCTSYKIYAVLF